MNNPVYVGVSDTSEGLFENQYPTPRGMSYNSYIVAGEKVAVLDSVERDFGQEWMANIARVLGNRPVDYLVVHHMEPDHSANILLALEKYPEIKIVATARAISMLSRFFPEADFDGKTVAVKEGDSLDLGGTSLTFLTAPMVHWPEVMVSYEPSTSTLFSADAFGKFGALGYEDDWVSEARRYYFNIVGRYGAQVQTLLGKVGSLSVRRIAPLHGPVLDSGLERYLKLYDTWSSYAPETEGTAVIYASIYGGTKAAAEYMADILRSAGEEVVTCDLCRQDSSEAVSQAFRMARLVLAAPTYDGGLFPPMDDFLNHLRSKGFRNRKAALIENGSWAPVSGKLMAEALGKMRDVEVVSPVVTVTSTPDRNTLAGLEALAQKLRE